MIVLIILLAAGSLDRWIRGRRWIEPAPPVPALALAGAAVGAVALGLAVLVASPILERVSARSIEWTQLATVRGNFSLLFMAAILAAAQAAAAELVYHRWIADRLRELGAPAMLGVGFAAIAEGAVAGGPIDVRAGAGLAGLGFGLLYLGAGRRLAPVIAARLVFEVGALLLVGLRVL